MRTLWVISGSAKFSVYDDIKPSWLVKGIPERDCVYPRLQHTAAGDKLVQCQTPVTCACCCPRPKMGAGTNVQKRLVGCTTLTPPGARPTFFEKREGRIIRRGNDPVRPQPDGFDVSSVATPPSRPTTPGAGRSEHKARGIEQLRNYDGSLKRD